MARWARTLSLLSFSAFAACGGGGGGSPTGGTPFIPDLQNLWQDTRDQNHEFNFTDVAQPGQASSNFNGREKLANGSTNSLSGRYTERSIQFILERPPGGTAGDISYVGNFTNMDRIELSSTSGNLTLCRAITGPCS
jgi:hypothetical protein